MFIAFEGPDNVGKSSSAAHLASDQVALYNATKDMHAHQLTMTSPADTPDWVTTYDRIDWLTHMVYRLALPEGDWNDDRPRTVFAMPETHLVFKLHHPQFAEFVADETVHTPIARVNPMYSYFADFFLKLNERQHFSLFKTVSVIEVINDPRAGGAAYQQRLIRFSSPVTPQWEAVSWGAANDVQLLSLLRHEDSQR